MALTRIQRKLNNPNTSDTSPSSTFLATATAGNLLTAFFAANENAGDVTLTGPAGFTQLATDSPKNNTGSCIEYAYYKLSAAGTESAITGTWSAARKWVVEIFEHNDSAAGAWALDKSASNSGNSTNPDSGTTATTTQANEVWLAGLINKNVDIPSTPTNGFTAVDEGHTSAGGATDIGFGFYEKIVSATGAANVSNTLPTHTWVGIIMTFYAIPASLPSPPRMRRSPLYRRCGLFVPRLFIPGLPDLTPAT